MKSAWPLATALIVLAAATAEARTGGVYPLEHGFYVATDSGCDSAPNAALRRYDGRGIAGAHSRACVARILSRTGKTYRVNQSCIDAGAGPAPHSSERQSVRVDGPRRFTLGTDRFAMAYRYCPPASLPPGIRSALGR